MVTLTIAQIMYILVYMKITQQTQEWGNSTGIRIPKKVLQVVKWKNDQEVFIDVKGSSIVLTPVKKDAQKLPTIDQLLEGVTPGNVHPAVDWGPDVGREIIND
jgi:antitoxin MazE